jgi:hypothetical protein
VSLAAETRPKLIGQFRRPEAKAHAIPAGLHALEAYASRPKVGAAAKVDSVEQRPEAPSGTTTSTCWGYSRSIWRDVISPLEKRGQDGTGQHFIAPLQLCEQFWKLRAHE